jgi:hypothetical protein
LVGIGERRGEELSGISHSLVLEERILGVFELMTLTIMDQHIRVIHHQNLREFLLRIQQYIDD